MTKRQGSKLSNEKIPPMPNAGLVGPSFLSTPAQGAASSQTRTAAQSNEDRQKSTSAKSTKAPVSKSSNSVPLAHEKLVSFLIKLYR